MLESGSKPQRSKVVVDRRRETVVNNLAARYLVRSLGRPDGRPNRGNAPVLEREVLAVRMLRPITAALVLAALAPASADGAEKLKALIITGANNHKWQETTEVLKAVLEENGKMSVDVAADPEVPIFSEVKKLAGYDLIVLNLNQGKRWTSIRERNFLSYVREGGGLLVYHAADNAFSGWDEYDKLVGGTWRSKGTSFPEKGTFHPKYGPFEVKVVDENHPITAGIKSFKTTDEMYSNLKLQDNIHVLAQGETDGKPQPLLFVSEYGKGKMFQTALGHDVNAMKTPEFRETLKRGAAWAARTSTAK